MLELDHQRLIDRDFLTLRAFRVLIARLEVGGAADMIFVEHAEDGSCCARESSYATVRALPDALERENGKHVEVSEVEV